ncbi:hypothetical protein EDB87DRAFT_1414700 [Lactarius vividus]|nr:hypothetical protein EDB87DRAFT_1414700 [Lactarius vividus]
MTSSFSPHFSTAFLMPTQIRVFIPLLSILCVFSHNTTSCVGDLRRARAFLRHRGGELRRNTGFPRTFFAVQPEAEDRGGRMVPVAEMATEHVKGIILYAAAAASAPKRNEFYRIVSTQLAFKVSAGKMFEGFVLSWLYTNSNVDPLRCFATGQLDLEVPTFGEEQTTFFDGKNGLEQVNGDKLPLCLLPTSNDTPTAEAIVITDEFIITI